MRRRHWANLACVSALALSLTSAVASAEGQAIDPTLGIPLPEQPALLLHADEQPQAAQAPVSTEAAPAEPAPQPEPEVAPVVEAAPEPAPVVEPQPEPEPVVVLPEPVAPEPLADLRCGDVARDGNGLGHRGSKDRPYPPARSPASNRASSAALGSLPV